MRHQRLRRKLGVKSQHRQALLRNLIRSLVIHKRIRTTVCKAREASAFSGELVKTRSIELIVSVATDIAIALIVGEDDEDVWLRPIDLAEGWQDRRG